MPRAFAGLNVAAADQPRKVEVRRAGAAAIRDASMWPRLISRGRGWPAWGSVDWCRGFNVAAADQPRKAPAGTDSRRRLQPGFNVAAADQPRKAVARAIESLQRYLLQCGRG